jgi:hypothetical protein
MEGAEMTEPAPRRRGVRRWRVLVLVAAVAALLAGCDLATGTVRTATELEKAGIRNPNLNYDGGTATVEYDANPNPFDARAEQDQAAAIIWRHLPFRIERVTVVARDGLPSREYPRALLEQQLGPRPAGLDRSVEDIARRATLIAVVVALVVLVLVVVVIVLVVRAVRRRPGPQPPGPPPPGGWPQAGGPQPWGQPGPQPGWGQPGPQQGWSQPPPAQQPWGAQPPSPAWPPPAPPQGAPPPPPQGEPPGPAGAEPPSRGPGDTQRLEPGPPPPPQGEEPGPVPPA